MAKAEILRQLFQLLPRDLVKFVVLYGNINGRDGDVFLALKNSNPLNGCKHNSLDIGWVGLTVFEEMLRKFDPMVTETVLNGRLIYGKGLQYNKNQLDQQNSN